MAANYSTAFDSYWARGRVGLNRGHMTFGPEFIAMGNDAFDAQRAGGFVMFDVSLVPNMPIEVTLSGGYQFLMTIAAARLSAAAARVPMAGSSS